MNEVDASLVRFEGAADQALAEQAGKDARVGLEDRVAERFRERAIEEGRFFVLPCSSCRRRKGATVQAERVLCAYCAEYAA